jgi:CBS domain-containing protein
MLVRELMSTHPITVTRQTRVVTALALMSEHQITTLPVVTADGLIEGVVSEADVLKYRVAPDQRHQETPWEDSVLEAPRFVEDVMTPHALTVHAETDVADAVDLFTSSGVKSLPVVDRAGQITGMISRSDVVRALAKADDDLAGEVDDLLMGAGFRDWYVEANDGEVHLTGAGPERQVRLARALARTVPGVTGVVVQHVERTSSEGAP